MAAAGKRKALAWGVVSLLLLAAAGAAFSRPDPALIPMDQLQARSAVDAGNLAPSVPSKLSNKTLALQGTGDLPHALGRIADESGVSVVRLWSTTGVLLASSDGADETAATSAELGAIGGARGPGATASTLTDQEGVVRVFEPVVPLKANATVAEIVRDTRETSLPFKAIAAGLGVLGLIALLVALVGAFSGSGRLAAASPAPSSGPAPSPGPAVPADSVEPGPDRDIDRMAQKLKTSEASRAAMETQMEQLRAQLRMGSQGAEQVVAGLDASLSSSQLRVHDAQEKLAAAEARAIEAEQRAATAEEALSRATPSEAADRVVSTESELAQARNTIAELEGAVSEHQARTRDAEARAGEADRRAADIEARAAVQEDKSPDEVTTKLQIDLARAQDLAEQALAKLEAAEVKATTAESRVAELEAKIGDAESRIRDAEARAAVAGAPIPKRAPKTGAAPRRKPDAPPAIDQATTEPEASAPSVVSYPVVLDEPVADAPAAAAVEPAEPEAPSATDPGAWKALAKSLRREALGDEAEDEPEEEEAPSEPTAPLTDDDRSELRARLAKASAKKRRKIE